MDSPNQWPLRMRILREIDRLLFRLLSRLEVRGGEKIPTSGPFLFVSNHLHVLDPPIGFLLLDRPITFLVASTWESTFGLGHFLRWTESAIPVDRGGADRKAMGAAVKVLKGGGALAIAPEGTRSKTGGLQQGHPGVAYLASRTGVPIVPVGISGQEKAFATLRRLRRPRIIVEVGEPFVLPGSPNRAKGEQLEAYTDQIMYRIAELLPPQYRGVYALPEADE
ncbi:MAG: lysophospholipid acyltransferase family protein [Chloroflexota bacterium]|nr:lysophospholipid acyltransferase family protein [Chloroflexota bacterium]